MTRLVRLELWLGAIGITAASAGYLLNAHAVAFFGVAAALISFGLLLARAYGGAK
jgi:hypothetical protein